MKHITQMLVAYLTPISRLIIPPIEQVAMADIGDLPASFETLREKTLPGLGLDNPTWGKIVAARLLIERVGEQDANYWWDSQVLGSFGRETLNETVPRTATYAQISLATSVGQKVENERTGAEEVVSLFDLGPFVESRIDRELESLDDDGDLSILNSLSVEITETGWTDQLTDATVPEISGAGNTYELGSTKLEDLQTESILNDVVSQLIAGYGAATKHELIVPYYSIEP